MIEEYEIEEQDKDQDEGGELDPKWEKFSVKDEEGAMWVLDRMATIKARIERIKEQAAAMVAFEEMGLRSLEFRFNGQLQDWARDEIQKRKQKTKSIQTLQGTVGFRNVPAKWTVVDEEKVWAQVKARPELAAEAIKVEEKLLKTPLYKYVEDTGEVLDGLERTLPGETFYIKFPKAGQEAGAEG